MLASVPINEVRRLLLDAGSTAYSAADLLGFLNEALAATANVKKDFYVVHGVIDLVAGILQALPEDGVALIDITHNIGSGKVCTQVDKDLLQEANRFWPVDEAEEDVENWAFSPKDPTRFLVTPPNLGGSAVALFGAYGAVPPEVTDPSQDMPVGRENQHALVNFMLARSYAISSKRYDPTKEAYYMNEWKQILGLKSTSTIAVSPKVSESPGM
jgi:hypothetical protein